MRHIGYFNWGSVVAKIVKVGVFKCGNIGTAPLIELLLDELAEREDIRVRTVTTGSKITVEDVEEALPKLFEFNPDLVVLVSPNAAVSGPAKSREILSKRRFPCVVISDALAKKIIDEIEKQGLGYIIVLGDPLIGARREFLDPSEMAIFNANIIKVLAVTGVLRFVHQEIDKIIAAIKEKEIITLPKIVIDTEYIRDNSDFSNPYAKAKAMAAYELTKKIAEIDQKACFIEKEKEKYILLVACAHEIAQAAAKLAEEAREIEKHTDDLVRRPHSREGKLLTKTKLLLSPKSD
jgi:methylenetetrahydromethanopterin dehydrogenase